MDTSVSQALLCGMKDSSPNVRLATVGSVRQLKLGSKPVILRLIEVLRDADAKVRIQAAHALAETSGAEKIVPIVIEAFKGTRDDETEAIANALDTIGPRATKELCEAILHEDGDIRGGAIVALGKLGSHNGVRESWRDQVRPRVAKGLKDSRVSVRRAAAKSLSSLVGNGGKDIVLDLVAALGDCDSIVRARCCEAIGNIGARASEAIPGLVGLLKDENWRVRCAAAEGLGKIGPLSRVAVPQLASVLEDDRSVRVRCAIAEALGVLGKDGLGAKAALRRALSDEDSAVRESARRALKSIGVGEDDM
jgi:HEAT repeat protein